MRLQADDDQILHTDVACDLFRVVARHQRQRALDVVDVIDQHQAPRPDRCQVRTACQQRYGVAGQCETCAQRGADAPAPTMQMFMGVSDRQWMG